MTYRQIHRHHPKISLAIQKMSDSFDRSLDREYFFSDDFQFALIEDNLSHLFPDEFEEAIFNHKNRHLIKETVEFLDHVKTVLFSIPNPD